MAWRPAAALRWQVVVLSRPLLLNPLTVLVVGVAGGVAAGYLLHRYRKEIVLAVSKACSIGKDFALQQKESLADLMEEAREHEAGAAPPAGDAAGTSASGHTGKLSVVNTAGAI
jgi:hypothetical protein